jgi:hypothetical protein
LLTITYPSQRKITQNLIMISSLDVRHVTTTTWNC